MGSGNRLSEKKFAGNTSELLDEKWKKIRQLADFKAEDQWHSVSRVIEKGFCESGDKRIENEGALLRAWTQAFNRFVGIVHSQYEEALKLAQIPLSPEIVELVLTQGTNPIIEKHRSQCRNLIIRHTKIQLEPAISDKMDAAGHDIEEQYSRQWRIKSLELIVAPLSERNLELDADNNRIRIKQKWFDLPQKQMEVLSPLFKAKGQLVAGKEICDSKGKVIDRVDKVIKEMPPQVAEIIESSRQGYRIPALLKK